MRAKAALSILGCLLISSACAKTPDVNTDKTIRIASTSLCGDSYVLALAPEYVSALSWQSRDSVSMANEGQRALPQARDDVETLLALNPTHVVFGPGEGFKTKPHLEARGIKTVSLNWGEDFKTVQANMDKFTPITKGHFDFPLWIGPEYDAIADAPKVLYLSRSGGTAGPGTYIDAVITAAGGRNIIQTPGWLPAEPETIISLKPDLIVTSYFSDGYASAQSGGMKSRIFQDLVDTTPNVEVPGKFWSCANPNLTQAFLIVADALKAVR